MKPKKNIHLEAKYAQAGYTLDQTILIVAIIAVLITLIVATVGWNLLNRSAGTKMAAHLNQVEKAIGTFNGRFGQWPHVALDNDSNAANAGELNNIRALNDVGVFSDAFYTTRHNNLLNGFQNIGGAIRHQFGSGGDVGAIVTTANIAGSAISGQYYVISFDNVPFSEAQEADDAIDGSVDLGVGRIRAVATGAACTAAEVTGNPSTARICYIANLVN